jgi:hypothetical protein
MKVFLITPEGEHGPLTVAQINRLHSQGQLKPDQLCRVDGAGEIKPIAEVFRHLAPKQEVVTAARKQVAAYNRDAGNSGVVTGSIMLVVGVCCILFFNPFNIGVGLLIVGTTLIARGQAELRKAEKARAAFHAAGERAPWESAVGKPATSAMASTGAAETEVTTDRADTIKSEPKTYDY